MHSQTPRSLREVLTQRHRGTEAQKGWGQTPRTSRTPREKLPPAAPRHPPSQRGAEKKSPRAAGVLILVLCVLAILLSTVFLAAATFRARLRLTRDTLRREAVRDELLLCVSNAVEILLADTNAVDHLGEPWATPLAKPPLRCLLSDENALIPLPMADTNLLAAALAGSSGAEPPPVVAARLVAWRDNWRAAHADAAPPAFGFWAAVVGDDPGVAVRLRTVASPYAGGPVNLNTASPEVVAAVLRAAGAAPDMAAAMSATLAATRASGAVAGAIRRRTLATLLLGGRPPTEEESRVLDAAAPLFGTSTSLFHGHFSSPRPAVSIEFVYDRATGHFLLWDEDN